MRSDIGSVTLRCLALLAAAACLGNSAAQREVSAKNAVGSLKPCPAESTEMSTKGKSAEAFILFENKSPSALQIFWVDPGGEEQNMGSSIDPGGRKDQRTYVGHLFSLRDVYTRKLVMSYRVSARDAIATAADAAEPSVVVVEACAGISGKQRAPPLDTKRWEEFEELAKDHNTPCVGPSTAWSCIRHVSDAEFERRDPLEYGFQEGEVGHGNPYKLGTTIDHVWMGQQKHLVNVTAYEGGILKMHMTEKMKSLLYPWYEQRLKDSRTRHETIPGFFTNNHIVPLEKIELNRFPQVRDGVVREMQEVLQWWTKMPLQHTTTFGLRIYHRNSMLINHLDRKDTHVASAVIQVGAQADEGWPLEVIHPHRPGRVEVYLQPGEMVLYEGARIVHGRPMRFKGDLFTNMFSHFKPIDWRGPTSWENPFFSRERDKLHYPELESALEL